LSQIAHSERDLAQFRIASLKCGANRHMFTALRVMRLRAREVKLASQAVKRIVSIEALLAKACEAFAKSHFFLLD